MISVSAPMKINMSEQNKLMTINQKIVNIDDLITQCLIQLAQHAIIEHPLNAKVTKQIKNIPTTQDASQPCKINLDLKLKQTQYDFITSFFKNLSDYHFNDLLNDLLQQLLQAKTLQYHLTKMDNTIYQSVKHFIDFQRMVNQFPYDLSPFDDLTRYQLITTYKSLSPKQQKQFRHDHPEFFNPKN